MATLSVGSIWYLTHSVLTELTYQWDLSARLDTVQFGQ